MEMMLIPPGFWIMCSEEYQGRKYVFTYSIFSFYPYNIYLFVLKQFQHNNRFGKYLINIDNL
jgi:hypothetical protein